MARVAGGSEHATQTIRLQGPAAVPANGGKPSVAVMPLVILGTGAEGRRIADAIAEDMITALSKHRTMLVVARESSYALKGSVPTCAASECSWPQTTFWKGA